MTKPFDSALDALLTACAASSDAEIRRLAAEVLAHRKPRAKGRPKAALPDLEEAMLPGSDEAFIAWQATPEAKQVWSETEVCRQIASTHGVSINTVKPLVRAILERLAPKAPTAAGFTLLDQLNSASLKSVKK